MYDFLFHIYLPFRWVPSTIAWISARPDNSVILNASLINLASVRITVLKNDKKFRFRSETC